MSNNSSNRKPKQTNPIKEANKKILSQAEFCCCRFSSTDLQPLAGLGNMVGRQLSITKRLFKSCIAIPPLGSVGQALRKTKIETCS